MFSPSPEASTSACAAAILSGETRPGAATALPDARIPATARAAFESITLRSGPDLNLVFLDDRIGQQLLAHGLEFGFGLVGIGFRKVQVDHLALTHLADRAEAQPVQSMADGLAL